ncbi:flavin-containing monooxygenase 5-like isoform X1 [Haliotis cracherodii]|uniref:flavin-containing monooxygenase 5-like isoform X1 n=2 Tax=Haliotis cracherodii TaxID=6455 RepID=UPI0039EA1B96
MASETPTTRKDVIIIGAGISGLVTAKCLKDDGLNVVVLERTGEVGGLWTFRENDYGVMRFTHINVSKYNYSFSDFPFPDDVPDYPHNIDMAKYIADYTTHFKLEDNIQFNTKVLSMEKKGDEWVVETCSVEEDGKAGLDTNIKTVFTAPYLAVASGHHAKPTWGRFKGEETFPGERIHSVDFNDAISNGYTGKRVLIVGIGNSAVDAAVNCATVGRCKSVYISTRSGCWVIPNYIFGFPTDLYACRAFFLLPWRWANMVLETVIKLVSGNPRKWNLNPKMRAMQTQPTVSPTLVHHIQRKEITVVPNILRIEGEKVYFVNGESAEFDKILYCTGYSIDLPYLPDSVKDKVVVDNSNELKLFKNVFSPDIGKSLAFIGFVQPASGGVLTMSETQARWFSEVIKGRVKLPSNFQMEQDITREKRIYSERWYKTARHTIQKDPILYNDEVASFFGAKPEIWRHPLLAWRLLFSSCGASQWRLQGPHAWSGAEELVRKTPMTDMMNFTGFVLVVVVGVFVLMALCCMCKVTAFLF